MIPYFERSLNSEQLWSGDSPPPGDYTGFGTPVKFSTLLISGLEPLPQIPQIRAFQEISRTPTPTVRRDEILTFMRRTPEPHPTPPRPL